jgi:hypothetical protein
MLDLEARQQSSGPEHSESTAISSDSAESQSNDESDSDEKGESLTHPSLEKYRKYQANI